MSVEQFITEHLDLWAGAVTTKSAGGRGSNGQVDTTGIKKLRELILELAVRGKLVPQNDSDEPAQTLQKRIAKEKSRLQADGQIKKHKELPAVTEDEVRFDIPSNWIWTRLGTIAQISPRNTAEEQTEASFIPMPLITTSYTGEHSQEKRQWSAIKKGYTHFADGDIAVAKITPCFENGKAAVFRNLHNGIGTGTTELHVARPYGSTIDPFFILCCLKSPGFLIRGEARMTGTAGQKRLPKDFFATDPIPLPPLAEQHRIVQKVDELMALCDRLEQQTHNQHAAHETLVDALLDTLTQSKDADELADNWARLAAHFDTLFTTEQSIERLEQAILQLAVRGKLVLQDHNEEPGAELLAQVAVEKKRLTKIGAIRKSKTLPEISVQDEIQVPEGWEPARMGTFISLVSGQHLKPEEYFNSPKDNSIPYLTGPAEFGDLYPTPSRYTFEKRAIANAGDILITCKGSGVGNLNRTDNPIAISRQLMAIRPILVDPDFVFLLLKSLRGSIRENIVGIAIPGISREDITDTLVFLPPLGEQHRITRRVSELLEICDRIKDHLDHAGEIRHQMADAVVEQAIH